MHCFALNDAMSSAHEHNPFASVPRRHIGVYESPEASPESTENCDITEPIVERSYHSRRLLSMPKPVTSEIQLLNEKLIKDSENNRIEFD